MNGCCNLRIFNYAIAWLHITLAVVYIAIVIICLSLSYLNELIGDLIRDMGTFQVIVINVIVVLIIPLFVTLLFGLKNNSLRLIAIYLHGSHVVLALGCILVTYTLIHGLVEKQNVKEIFLELLYEIPILAAEILLTIPPQIQYNRLKLEQRNAMPILLSVAKSDNRFEIY